MSDRSRTYYKLCDYLPYLAPLLATAFLYHETLVRLGGGLMTYENSHGLVIVAISLYLAWGKRHELRRLPLRPNLLGGSVLAGIGCSLLIAGQYGSSVIMTDVSMIVSILGIVCLLLGTEHLKILSLPIGYLLFAYPIFDYLPQGVIIHLQYVTAWLAAGMLKLLGISVHHTGIYLELPNVTLQVAQVCAGMNHIIALLAVSVLLAYYNLEGAPKRILLVAAALLIGIAANGLRVGVIGIMSMLGRDTALHGPSDIFYVSFVFIIGLALIIGLNYLLGGKRFIGQTRQMTVGYGREAEPGQYRECGGGTAGRPQRASCYYMTLLMATLIPLSAYAYNDIFKPQPVPMMRLLENLPLRIGDWNSACVQKEDFVPGDIRPDEKLVRCYQHEAGDVVQVYVGYFTHQRKDRKVTDFTLNSYVEGDELNIMQGRERMTVRRAIPNRIGPKDNVYFWYSIGGRDVSSRTDAKIALLMNGIIRQKTNGAIVVLKLERRSDTAENASMNDREVIETFYPEIIRLLNS